MKRNLSSQCAPKQQKKQEEEEEEEEEEETLPQRNPSSGEDDDDEDDDDDDDEDDEEKDLQDDFGESDDDDDDEDEPAVEETLNVVGSSKFTSALKKLLVVGGGEDGEQQAEEEAIITSKQDLFLKKTKIQRLAEQEMREAKDKRRKLQARSEFDLRNLDTLQGMVDPAKINKERELKRTATRGVVALFNAIGSHQRVVTTTADPAVQAQSKENFLKMLKEKALGKAAGGGGAPPASGSNKKDEEEDEDEEEERVAKPSSWKVLQDDYLEQVAEDSDEEAEAEHDMTIREHE